MHVSWEIFPIMGLLIPIIIVPTSLAFRHAQHKRQLEHAERMKALELGRTLPRDESWWSPSRICVAFGVGVPVGVFGVAWKAVESDPYHSPAAWFAAGLVGLAGVISGAILALRHLSADVPARDHLVGKPSFDADAFDVVGSRG